MSDRILEQAKNTLSLTSEPAELAEASACPTSEPTIKNSPTLEKNERTTIKDISKKSLLGDLNMDLKNALDSWDTLTEQMGDKLSPDEEQLLEVKKLLGALKSQLDEFVE